MNKISFTLIAFLFAVTLFLACNNSGNKDSQSDTSSVVKDTTTVNKASAEVYQCPMKCEGEKTYAQAGKCPDCGMDMEKISR